MRRDVASAYDAPFQNIRYLEDYSYMRFARGRSDTPLVSVKFVPLPGGAYISFGGQHRLRYEYTAPSEVRTSTSEPRESLLFSRNLLHADLHLDEHVRLFSQMGAFFTLGASGRDVPPDTNQLDVSQLFLEARGELAGIHVIGRVGRQEMGLGSTRWVSVRDPTNVRRSFDMVRLTLAGNRWSSHTFFALSPKVERGVFDDAPDAKSLFWGSYWTLPLAPSDALSADVFYLGRSRSATYRDGAGREIRSTVGLRFFGKVASGTEYIAHGLVQFGRVGEADILAWGASGTIWQRLPGSLRFARIGLRGDALSGDTSSGDRRVGTFDPLFPNQGFFSALPTIYPTNLYDFHPIVRLEYGPLAAEAGMIVYFRQSRADSVYEPPGTRLVTPEQSSARSSGSQSSLTLGYRATRNLSLDAEYSHFFVGKALIDGGGRDIDYLGTWTTFTY